MDKPHKRRWSFWQWLGLAFVLYIYPALVFTVDNDFFDGQLFTRLPSEVRAVVKFVYWPFGAMGQVWGDD
jgi:hypothetical protein